MCIIAIKPIGKKMFTKEQLQIMFDRNGDGGGFMYYDAKHKCVQISKGYTSVKAMYADLTKRDLTNTNVVVHFRIGTSGKMDALNCHPYPIYQKNAVKCRTDIGMAHNGVLYDYTPKKGSDINDTQVFIKNILSGLKKGFQRNTDILRLIQELIGTNKLAFLDDRNKITLIGNFIEDDGYIYSNTSYKAPIVPKSSGLKKVFSKGKTDYYKPSSYLDFYKKDDKPSINDMYYQQEDFWKDTQESGFWKDYDDTYLY